MKANLEVSPGSPEHTAVEEFLQFGAPFEDVPGTVIEVTGPPGVATTNSGAGLFQFMPVAGSAAAIPDLEVRVVGTEGSILHAVDLVDVQTSAAVAGPGWYLSGRDRGGAVEFEFLINGGDGHTVQMNGRSLTGKTPNEILPALRLVADVRDGTGLVVAIRGGGPAVTPTWDMRDEPLAQLARFHVRLAEALAAIQQHTVYRVTVLDVEALTGEDLDQILRVGRLVRGEQIEAEWSELPLTVASPANVPPGSDEFVLGAMFPLTVRLDGQNVELDMRRRVLTWPPDSRTRPRSPPSKPAMSSTSYPARRTAPSSPPCPPTMRPPARQVATDPAVIGWDSSVGDHAATEASDRHHRHSW
jgi:hypothetical protein